MLKLSTPILIFAVLALRVLSVLAPGDLDSSFGTVGKVITDVNIRRNSADDGVLQSNGKIVTAGAITSVDTSEDFLLVRYNTDGTLDSTFGIGGVVIVDHDGQSNEAKAVALQSDGKIIAFGQSRTIQSPATYELLAIRVNADGTLDTSFGTGGKATTSWGTFPQFGNAVLIQPDGKIVGAGQARDASNLPAMGVVRFNADGTLDNTFGSGGKVIISFGGEDVGVASSVNLQTDGMLVLAGTTDRPVTFRDFAVARLNTIGSMDPTFGTGGKVITDVNGSDNLRDSLIQPDGKIIVFGFSATGGKLAMLRYNSDGSLDSSFGEGGKVETNPIGGENFGTAVTVQPDGKILAAGSCGFFPDRNFAVLRYNPNGTLDNSFGTNGIVITPIGTGTLDNPSDILLQQDGKFVVPGEVFSDGPTGLDIAIVRYLNDLVVPAPSSVPFDYDGDGRADLSVRRPTNNIWYLQRGTAGYTAQEFGVAGDRMVPADYDGDGKTDVAVFRPSTGTWFVYMSQSQTFQQFGWGQDGDIPVPTDRDADGKADLVIYRESNNTWYTRFANATFNTFQFGVAGDKPMLGDFDGDGIGDVALFRPSNNNWYLLKSSLGFFVQTWGQAGDIPLTGDFDGDGATDQAVFRPATGQWFLSRTTAGFSSQNWGQNGDIPVAADYDGDGKTDVAVFRPSNGTWYIVNSTTGILVLPFGQDGDVPTQASYIY